MREAYSMGRRLEKYYLFCNTIFGAYLKRSLSDIYMYDKIHSKLEQKNLQNIP